MRLLRNLSSVRPVRNCSSYLKAVASRRWPFRILDFNVPLLNHPTKRNILGENTRLLLSSVKLFDEGIDNHRADEDDEHSQGPQCGCRAGAERGALYRPEVAATNWLRSRCMISSSSEGSSACRSCWRIGVLGCSALMTQSSCS